APKLKDFLELDDAAFRVLFSGSPVKRIGRARFIRNVLTAAGNSGDASFGDVVEKLLSDESPLVRGAAVWALQRLSSARAANMRESYLAREADDTVRAEWA
ncbi:MAG: HEAT repeat domain-containing protein, partial [Rhodospirillaceae bacterium]|nr:HEAT repeat domain-containing protein [Rhodospirillaceae bacterium]